MHRYGWRAYALPLLTVITVVALAREGAAPPATGHAADQSAAAASIRSHGDGAAAANRRGTQFEGLTGDATQYQPGSTPAPIVINLKADRLTSCATNTYAQLILVSISQQHLWACQGSQQVNSSPITTGKMTDGDQTPLGSWRVQDKQRDRYLVGPGYRDYVQYWMPFNGDFGLHDASWQTMPFGSKRWRSEGSHGCVHTPTPVMAWLYKWAKIGQTVVTIET